MDGTLRLYANPLKLILYLVACLGFVAAGVFILYAASSQGGAAIGVYVIAAVDLAFFGLGVVVFVIMLVRNLMFRRPVLTIDAHGWRYAQELGVRAQTVSWPEIASVAIFKQQINRTRMYHLVLEARNPAQLPASRVRSLTTRMYPTMAESLLIVPLNDVFVRATPAKLERLLQDIHTRFASELNGYGITVADTIQEM